MHPPTPKILFYPTSPVQVRDLSALLDKLPGWTCEAIVYRPLARIAPGIAAALSANNIASIEVEHVAELPEPLPHDPAVLMLGAIFEPFALDLLTWAKARRRAVCAFEEVAQLALNQLDICNYDAPLDRLFVASTEEKRLFIELGHPAENLRVTGLLANDRFTVPQEPMSEVLRQRLGVQPGESHKPIVYTTSPLRSRRAIHNKDDAEFRSQLLSQLSLAAQRTGRAIIVKLHPNEDLERERERIHKVIPQAIVVGRDIGMEDLFCLAGVIVNRGNSQTCLEAVLRGLPTVVAAADLETLFHQDGGAYIVSEIGNLANVVEKALVQSVPVNTAIRRKHFHLPVEGVAAAMAREMAELVCREWPPQPSTRTWLIKSYLFFSRHERARVLCEQSMFDSPWFGAVHAALAAHANGRRQDAIQAWSRLCRSDPSWFFPHYELAHCLNAEGNFRAALEHARRAIALHPPFHRLWHEIPMRVLAAIALRELGERQAAADELQALEQRGLLAVVPELQIEAAAQWCAFNGDLDQATGYVERALGELLALPIRQETDSEILSRALCQYLAIALLYRQSGQPASAIRCLERVASFASADDRASDMAVSQYCCALGEKCEGDGDWGNRYYTLARLFDPQNAWVEIRSTALAIKQANFRQALFYLGRAAAKPPGPRLAFEQTASTAIAKRVEPYWDLKPRSLIKPLQLAALVSGWALKRMIKQPTDRLSAPLLAVGVWLQVFRHFAQSFGLPTLASSAVIEQEHIQGASANPSITVQPTTGRRQTAMKHSA